MKDWKYKRYVLLRGVFYKRFAMVMAAALMVTQLEASVHAADIQPVVEQIEAEQREAEEQSDSEEGIGAPEDEEQPDSEESTDVPDEGENTGTVDEEETPAGKEDEEDTEISDEAVAGEETVSENDLEVTVFSDELLIEPQEVSSSEYTDPDKGIIFVLFDNTTTGNGIAAVKGHTFKESWSGVLDIPGQITVDGKNYVVMYVRENAFAWCDGLTEITIPNSVIQIEEGAFARCSNADIHIPDSVTYVGKGAFYECNQLASIPDGLQYIGKEAFWGCKMARIHLSSGVEVGEYAFTSCTKLVDVELPDDMTAIAPYMFYGCGALQSITLPKTLETIGGGAFCYCKNLQKIEIPSGIKTIKNRTFEQCWSLTDVMLPDTIEEVESCAFAACTSLERIEFPASVKRMCLHAFSSSNLKELVIQINDTENVTPIEMRTDENEPTYLPYASSITFVSASGEGLERDEFLKVRDAYLAEKDGNTGDVRWYGWRINDSQSYKVTIAEYKDDEVWQDSGRRYALKMDGENNFVTDFEMVPADVYTLYDITGIDNSANYLTSGVNTDVRIRVKGDTAAKIEYYTVTFYDGDQAYAEGTPQAPQIVIKGQKVKIPPEPLKDEWVFDVWCYSNGSYAEIKLKNEGIYQKTDVYATWNIGKYVSQIQVMQDGIWNAYNFGKRFLLKDTKGGWSIYLSGMISLPCDTYTIYDVTGVMFQSGTWDESWIDSWPDNWEEDCNTGVELTVLKMGANSVLLRYYTVKFHDGDMVYGNDTPQKPQILIEGKKAYPPSNPTKTGYTFAGWTTASGGGEVFDFDTEISQTTDLYASWDMVTGPAHKVTIKVNRDEKEWSGHNKEFALLEKGGTAFLTDLNQVPDGTYRIYDITGIRKDLFWSKASDTGISVRVNGADTGVDVQVEGSDSEAVVDYYMVTFYDGDDAYGSETEQSPQTVLKGKAAEKPAHPGKEGFDFIQWVTEKDGSTPFDFMTGIEKATRIYASWRPTTDIMIEASASNGGSIDPSGSVAVARGNDQTFTMTPDEGYQIKAVTVDGNTVKWEEAAQMLMDAGSVQTGKVGVYTFSNVQGNHTIEAAFETVSSSGDVPEDPDDGKDDPPKGDDKPNHGSDNDNKEENTGNDSGENNQNNGVVLVEQNDDGTIVAAPAATIEKTAAGSAPSPRAGQGGEPKTGDSTLVNIYATIAMIAGLTYLFLVFLEERQGMTEREKEIFVAAFIRWAKKGGIFRKCCAIAAIFCILFYFHSVGKRSGRQGGIAKASGIM